MQINDYGRNLSLVVFSYYLVRNLFLFPFNLCDATVCLRSLKAMEILDPLLSTTDIEIPFGKSNFNFSCQRFLEFSFGLHSREKNSWGQRTKFDKFWAFIYWQKKIYARYLSKLATGKLIYTDMISRVIQKLICLPVSEWFFFLLPNVHAMYSTITFIKELQIKSPWWQYHNWRPSCKRGYDALHESMLLKIIIPGICIFTYATI